MLLFKKILSVRVSLLVTLASLLAGLPGSALAEANRGKIVVANRAGGTISVIDTKTDTAMTVPLPGANSPEPMYVVYSPALGRVFVGDRANDQVAVFRTGDFSVEATVPAGQGVFHMWASQAVDQLWVSNDVDNTITVIDTITLDVITTIPLPVDLVGLGGKPHDVILAPNAPFAYVTMLGFAGDDYVLKYSTQTFQELDRAAVGKDPHVSLARQNGVLYVACQNTNELFLLDRDTLDEIDVLTVPGAHGAGMARNGKVFYTTNLPGGGTGGLVALDTRTGAILGAVDTPYAVPHNIALTPNGKKLYVTHSGATSMFVSVYTASRQNPVPLHLTDVAVGFNPFGLAFVP